MKQKPGRVQGGTLVLVCLLFPAAINAQVLHATVDSGRSTLSYRGHHFTHGWTGTSHSVSGTVRLNVADPASSAVEIVVLVASFDSGNETRDSNMRDILDAGQYPDVRFTSDAVRIERWEALPNGYQGAWTVRGALAFHGQIRTVEIPVSVAVNGSDVLARATFQISLKQFDIRRPKLLLKPISDEIDLEAEIYASPDTASTTP